MLIRSMLVKYYSTAGGEGDDSGGSGSGAPEIAPKVQKLTDEQASAQVSGLKDKDSELLGKLKKPIESLRCFESIDLDAVKTIPQRFSDDEEAQLIVARKIDEVPDKCTEWLRVNAGKQIKAVNECAERAETFFNKFRDRVLGDAIRSAAFKADALPEISDDLALRVKGTPQLNDEGEAVAVGANGDVLLDKDDKIPLTPVERAEFLRGAAPHLFPRIEGSGAGGHEPGGGGGSLRRLKMSSSDKADYIRKHGQQTYLRLPK